MAAMSGAQLRRKVGHPLVRQLASLDRVFGHA